MSETLNVAQIQESIYVCRILIIVPFTVLVYEYLLTLQREISAFWGLRLTWGSFFFYLNRYATLFGNIPILVQYFSTTTDPDKLPVCRVFRAYHQYFALLSQVLVAIILIMRTYALYERDRRILSSTILGTLGAFVFAVYILLTGNNLDSLSPQLETIGCPLATSHSKSLRLAAAWSSMLLFDVTIFALTLFKALRARARHGGLLAILLRDGTIYFALMVVTNACNIGTYTMGNAFTRGSATTVTNVVSSITISRLMFNLRDPNIRRPQSSRTQTTTMDDPAISTISPYATEYTLNTRWTTLHDE
ncbi:hypothetical protein DFH06DRAFT_1300641 [Mycena polygramma]|nr:hypothetical protein DFH06DRAFT_1300641 [Mycena polygramma]